MTGENLSYTSIFDGFENNPFFESSIVSALLFHHVNVGYFYFIFDRIQKQNISNIRNEYKNNSYTKMKIKVGSTVLLTQLNKSAREKPKCSYQLIKIYYIILYFFYRIGLHIIKENIIHFFRLIQCIIAVSYTHLDVYKRQVCIHS